MKVFARYSKRQLDKLARRLKLRPQSTKDKHIQQLEKFNKDVGLVCLRIYHGKHFTKKKIILSAECTIKDAQMYCAQELRVRNSVILGMVPKGCPQGQQTKTDKDKLITEYVSK